MSRSLTTCLHRGHRKRVDQNFATCWDVGRFKNARPEFRSFFSLKRDATKLPILGAFMTKLRLKREYLLNSLQINRERVSQLHRVRYTPKVMHFGPRTANTVSYFNVLWVWRVIQHVGSYFELEAPSIFALLLFT